MTGGGTGGHVYPALQVIESILKIDRASSCFYLGTKEGPEKALCEKRGIEFFPIHSGKLRRYRSVRNLLDPFNVLLGFIESFVHLRRTRPDILFSKGGFVSVPPAVAAHLLGIPVITHESDLTPGLATRIICRFACEVCVSSESAASYYDRSRLKVHVTGNPIKEEILDGCATEADRLFDLNPDLPLVLVLGGSQGALQINELIWRGLRKGSKGFRSIIRQANSPTERSRAPIISAPRLSKSILTICSRAVRAPSPELEQEPCSSSRQLTYQ